MDKAQAWYLDVVMAVFIFTAGIIAYQYYSLNIGKDDQDRVQEMAFEADLLSSELLKEGYPEDWNATTVVKIGLTGNNQRIDEVQWARFSSLNYSISKELLGVSNDYVVFFEEKQGNVTMIGGICGVGSQKTNFTLVKGECVGPSLPQVDDLIGRERYVFAKGDIIKMKVYVFS